MDAPSLRSVEASLGNERLEQLDRVARRVLHEDLPAPHARHDLILAKGGAGCIARVNTSGSV
jgi:hypothetical protein